MKLTKKTNLNWENWKKDAPIKWNVFQVAMTGFLAAMIPVIPEIRSMGTNTKHDLGSVLIPVIIGLFNFIGLFVAKNNSKSN